MKNQIIGTLVLQYIVGGIYLIGTGLWDAAATLSALVGCVAALVPKTYFGLRMIRATENNKDAAQWLGYAYRSEIGKWVIMGTIFVLAFTSGYSWDPVVLFAGFVLIQMSGWLAPFVIKGN
ncbi:MAG: ATP synthase subunit I [Gammaproteobacteria bacterium]|nr:ATP synthase subunit I [Gammaproteobacteria bacterium]MDH3449187.1 ATP synthase subunit I [Gammaproteobacteria bacterium]